MKHHSTIRASLIITVLLVFGAVGAYGVLFHTINKKSEKLTQSIEATITETEWQNYVALLEGILQETEASRSLLTSYFIEADNIVGFIEKIEKMAKANGLKLVVTSVDTVEMKGTRYEMLKLKLTLAGSWSNTIGFLASLENLPLKISFENIHINKGGEDKNKTAWNTMFDMRVVKYK